MPNTHVVRKNLSVGSDKPLLSGTEVDASEWLNREALERTGYIAKLEKPMTLLGASKVISKKE